jgi:hypothetical protein
MSSHLIPAQSMSWLLLSMETPYASAIWSMDIVRRAGRRLVVFVDNSAAEFAIRRGYSSNAIANTIMAKSGMATQFVEMRRVHTTMNPSDKPSRGMEVVDAEVLRACKGWNDPINWHASGSKKKSIFSVRHLEPADEAEVEAYIKEYLDELRLIMDLKFWTTSH